ncbi:MAG TPA: hypothetical protein VLH60_05340 [Sedimentisphaerales bacterium]|nr:hypothetical protein [Sedimentisphaerales bacterium]
MKRKDCHIAAFAALSVAAAILGGCGYLEQKPVSAPAPQVDTTPIRFEGAGGANLTAVESSLLLAEKYAAIAVESEQIRQENRLLTEANVEMSKRNAALQAELDQTARELKEANAMLIDMRIEINNWKNNILGFRDEMRESQKAQIEALVKIKQLLGGEISKGQPAGAGAK